MSSSSGNRSPFKYAGSTNSIVHSDLHEVQYKITGDRNFVSHPYLGYDVELTGNGVTYTTPGNWSFLKGAVAIEAFPGDPVGEPFKVLAEVISAQYDDSANQTTFTLDETIGVKDGSTPVGFTGYIILSGQWNTIMGPTNCVMANDSSYNVLIGNGNIAKAPFGRSCMVGSDNKIFNQHSGLVFGSGNRLYSSSYGTLVGHNLKTHKNDSGFPTVIGKGNSLVAGAAFTVGNSWDKDSTLMFSTYGAGNRTRLYIAGVGGYDGYNVESLDRRYGVKIPKMRDVRSLQEVLHAKSNCTNERVSRSQSSGMILPNRYYTFEGDRTTLEIRFIGHESPFTETSDTYPVQNNLLDRYEFQFEVGAIPCNLTLPPGVKIENGFDLSTVTNAIVQVCITNKCAKFSVFSK